MKAHERNKINNDILMVGDTPDELARLQEHLIAEHGTVLMTDQQSDGVKLFIEHRPSILMLAFEEVEKAEHFYLSLFRHDSHIQQHPHQTLLLCKASDSEKAYQLFKSGSIDDYVADRPLYDPHRLHMSVKQSLERHRIDHHRQLNSRLEQLSSGVDQFNNLTRKMVETGTSQSRDSLRKFHLFTNRLSDDIKQLEKEMRGQSRGDSSLITSRFDDLLITNLNEGGTAFEKLLTDNEQWFDEFNMSYTENIAELQKIRPTPKRIKALFIDDDELYLELIADMLDDEFTEIIATSDCSQALANLPIINPDIVLLDYKMPIIDGIKALKIIKSDHKTAAIPVIMLTGAHSRELVEQSLHAGADGFIVKPGDRNLILEKIHSIISERT
ncbi:hypothetical protein BOW53_12340 [Solemya pervernicosa gill symbiont]|uniref:Response regulatory domain-containing protein n=1 Tax=Solemya pervernicosa gill symbiont TaxID=642797 RepID=A0A1T2L2B9_9GAMM|nr:response regulator [Solemya pervernicosa gill symbiont]OOZ39243.1 hypothetical protein BOW53_12340 [Solemya pervernicosa gill symbiont]